MVKFVKCFFMEPGFIQIIAGAETLKVHIMIPLFLKQFSIDVVLSLTSIAIKYK